MSEWGQVAHLAALYAHTRMQMQIQTEEENSFSGTVLSLREQECLRRVSRGISSKEAAQQMGLSPKTIDFHIANAMTKLRAATRSQAVVRAITLGLLEP